MILAQTVQFVVEECCTCGVPFAISEATYKMRRKDHGWFYCPNGHGQHYQGRTEEDKLKEQIAGLKEEVSRKAEEARRQRQDAEYFKGRAGAYKGQVTKLKNRASNGVCPCCNRYFENLHRHMQTKHKDYMEQEKPT